MDIINNIPYNMTFVGDSTRSNWDLKSLKTRGRKWLKLSQYAARRTASYAA